MKLVLPITLLLLTLLLLGAQLTLTTQDLQLTTELARSNQSYYLAEAAVAHAQARLHQDPSWRGTQASVPLGAGTYAFRIFEQGATIHIEATGEIGKIKTVLKRVF